VSEFVIVSDDPQFLKRKFEWTTSLGEIVDGQGTPRIRVRAEKNSANAANFTLLEVTAKIADQPDCDCKPQSVGIYLVPVSGPFPFFASVHKGRKTDIVNKFADVVDLSLSHSTVVLSCQPGYRPREGDPVPTSTMIDVNTSAIDPENDVLTYDYTVSGGIIKGTGSNVKWDLTDSQPGTYTITAGADDGCGICGKTFSQTVTVIESCGSCYFVECPAIDISGPPHVQAGREAVFTANVTGGSQQSITYQWTVTNGVVIDGEGTPTIKIRVAKALPSLTGRGSMSVTLTIGGLDPAGGCPEEISKDFLEGEKGP
jgi:hypothetical protein